MLLPVQKRKVIEMAKKSKDMSIEDLINEDRGAGRDLFKKISFDATLRELGLNFGQRMAERRRQKKKLVKKRNEKTMKWGMDFFSGGGFAEAFKPKKK